MRQSQPTVLVVNPSADHYGSDLQLLETVSAMTCMGWRVVVVVSTPGALIARLRDRGAEVIVESFPVLRRESASVLGVTRLVADVVLAWRRMRRVARQVAPSLGLVNTTTLPWWIFLLRTSGVPVVCHVHEAETSDGRFVRLALAVPLLAANRIMVISYAARTALLEVMPGLGGRVELVYNGVPDHNQTFAPPDLSRRPLRLLMAARISPRKGTDVALEALSILRRQGHDVDLDLCGTSFAGYDWFERQVRARSSEEDLAGHVHWLGYVSPIASALERAEVFIAPSRVEPFGNSVVEAQLAMRPVVASNIQGHLETVEDGVSGMHFTVDDPHDLARAIAALIDDPATASEMGKRARAVAVSRFSLEQYRDQVVEVLGQCVCDASARVGRPGLRRRRRGRGLSTESVYASTRRS